MIRSVALASLLLTAAFPAIAATRIEQAAAVRDAALAKSEAWPMLENLTTTADQRLAGTPAEARGRDWAVKAMKAAGLTNIKVEPFDLPVWERGTESAEIVGTGQKLAITALGYSGATPVDGITAPVVYFADYAALEAATPGSLAGKIAFIDHRMMRAQDTLVPLARRKADLETASYAAANASLSEVLQAFLDLAETRVDALDREEDVVRDAVRINLTYGAGEP